MKLFPHHLPMSLVVSLIASPCAAAEPPLQFEWDLRGRYEGVNDAGFAERAHAGTLRLRAGLRADFGHGFGALLEGEGIASAGDHYNSGANGRIQYPAVIDPRGGELNQAWVGWRGETAAATVGRQRVLLDNQRWVGNSGWRQNEQTFDAATLQLQPSAAWTLRYHWLDRVHRVAGDDARSVLARERALNSHLINAAFKQGAQQWTGYAYLHDDQDVATASSASYGLRWAGSRLHQGDGWGWTLEAARQRDHADNPLRFSHAYWLVEPSWSHHGVTARMGWEHLGGDGRHALQTPLATLHAMNGWADQFGVTPNGGLEDRYVGASGQTGRGALAGKLGWAVVFHDYRADQGGDYGSEWNASLTFPLPGGLTGMAKVADYRSDGFAQDVTKLWLQFEWRGNRRLGGAGAAN